MTKNSTTLTGREYLRVSVDASGRERSNDEQHDDNVNACLEEDIKITGTPYRDKARASRSAKTKRLDFTQLVADLEADRFDQDVLVMWESSRGSRRVSEWCLLLELLEERRKLIYVTTHRRRYDPTNPRDRRTLLEDAVDAEYESGKSALRIGRSMRANAVAGRATGGRRPFGFEVDRGTVTIRHDEARVIREAARLVLGGKTTRWVAGALNRGDLGDVGRTTSAGNPWHPGVLRKMLASPRLIGHRVHHGEVVNTAAWDPILDEVTHRRLVATLSTQPRGPRGDSPWVLTGFLRCELCEGSLSGHQDINRTRRYRCRKGPGYKGCGRLTIKAEPAEARLGDLVMLRLVDTDARRNAGVNPSDDSDELAELAEIAELGAELIADRAKGKRAGGIDAAEYRAIKNQLDARERDVNARLAAKTRETAELAFVIAESYVGRTWKSLSVDEQRDVLSAFVEHVTIGPATLIGSTRFETARVDATGRIAWKA